MLLEALIIVDSWFNGYLLADKVGIAYLTPGMKSL